MKPPIAPKIHALDHPRSAAWFERFWQQDEVGEPRPAAPQEPAQLEIALRPLAQPGKSLRRIIDSLSLSPDRDTSFLSQRTAVTFRAGLGQHEQCYFRTISAFGVSRSTTEATSSKRGL